jgi:succinate dehydrogenase/fumarate reductase flavoprotein subunit
MSENSTSEENLTDEFRNLGKNLIDVLHTAWESPERKKLQEEIESGLTEFGSSMKRELETFTDGPTGQQLKSDVEDLQERIRSKEVETKMREEILNTLRIVNTELEKVTGG